MAFVATVIPVGAAIWAGKDAWDKSEGDIAYTAGAAAAPWLYAATGSYGLDDKKKIDEGADAQMGFLRDAQREGRQAGQAAQTGLDPYAQTGVDANAQLRALAGLDGPEAQNAAIAQIQQSPQFQSMVSQSEQAILQNASATGGLRGSNTQDFLAGNRQQLLGNMIQQQLSNYGGLAASGQQAATQQGAFGLNAAGLNANIAGDRGAVASGSIIGQQAALNNGRQQAFGLLQNTAGMALNLGMGGGGLPSGSF